MLDYLTQLDGSTEGFACLLAEGDLQAPVPSCPGWQLTDLAEHLGQMHQWAAHAVTAGNPDGDLTPAPAGRPELVQWYRESAAALLSVLRGTDPAAPVWAFGPRPRTASFWYRRTAHESAIHHWDAATSQRAGLQLEAAFARDGIDEVVSMFFPRQVRLGRIPPLTGSLALCTIEASAPGSTTLWVLAGDGLGPGSQPDAPASASLTGPAEAVLLLIWGRIGLDDPRLRLDGDRQAALGVLQAGVTP